MRFCCSLGQLLITLFRGVQKRKVIFMEVTEFNMFSFPITILVVLGAIVIVAIGLYQDWFNSPVQKGKRGEGIINFSMKLHLDSNVYHLIPDVTLADGKGTTQIDHIVVSMFGIFVIETKNMKGWIYGNENQRRWTQVNYKKEFFSESIAPEL